MTKEGLAEKPYGPISTLQRPSGELTAVLTFRFLNISAFKKCAKLSPQNSFVRLSNSIDRFLPIFTYFWQRRHQTVAYFDRSLPLKWLWLLTLTLFIVTYCLIYFVKSSLRQKMIRILTVSLCLKYITLHINQSWSHSHHRVLHICTQFGGQFHYIRIARFDTLWTHTEAWPIIQQQNCANK